MPDKEIKEPVAIASTGAPTMEHRKADHRVLGIQAVGAHVSRSR